MLEFAARCLFFDKTEPTQARAAASATALRAAEVLGQTAVDSAGCTLPLCASGGEGCHLQPRGLPSQDDWHGAEVGAQDEVEQMQGHSEDQASRTSEVRARGEGKENKKGQEAHLCVCK